MANSALVRHTGDSLFHQGFLQVTPVICAMSDSVPRTVGEPEAAGSSAQPSAEFASLAKLHDLGTRYLAEGDVQQLLGEVLEIAMSVTHASRGDVQLFRPATRQLEIVAQRGLPRQFVELLGQSPDAPCTTALARRARVVIEDVAASHDVADNVRAAMLECGIRGSQATPLMARGGEVVGIVSMHFSEPCHSSDEQLRLVDLLARQATDFIDYQRLKNELEQALEREHQARARADAESSFKDRFIAMLAHELRQPLSAILPAIELQKRSLSPERRQRAGEIIEEQISHLMKLVDDVSDTSKISRGTLALHRERVDLRDVIRRELDTVAPHFATRRQQLTVDLPAEGVWIFGDATRLKQVFSNLLTNAANYTPRGGHVQATLTIGGDAAVFRLRDDGKGIPHEALERIFQPFERGDKESESPSVGIGLALVRQLVGLHGGSVSAFSAGRGQGSEFVVTLPLLSPAGHASVY
jgi:signal transduction histidine kinase